MVHILRHFSLDDRRMATMFEDRKRLFVDLLDWDVPVVDNRYEIDNFDGPDAIYLIAGEANGDHAGSIRLLPTTRPHILGELFADLCDGVVPAGNGIFEITRLCLPCRLGATRRLEVRNRLISAMVDHALASKISTLTGVVSWNFLEQILAMGWRCQALGQSRRWGGAWLGAFQINIDTDTIDRLTAAGIYRPGTLTASSALAA